MENAISRLEFIQNPDPLKVRFRIDYVPDGVHEVIEELVLLHEVARAEAWRCNAEVLHSGLHGESGCVLFTQAWPHDTIIGRDGLPICDVFQISRDMVASWSKACDFRTFRGQWYRHW